MKKNNIKMMKINISAEILIFVIFLTFRIGYSSSLDNGYYKTEGNYFLYHMD